MRFCVLLASAVLTSALAATPEELLTAAIKKAISNVDLVNIVAGDTIGEDHSPHTQKATADSVNAQKIGDIIQEATRILVEQNGADILSKFKGIDIKAVLEAQLGAKSTNRTKRDYGSGGGTDSNPLDVSCIDRPAKCELSLPYRSMSGWCNHEETANRAWGSTLNPFRRFMGEAKYDDGFNSVRRNAANGGLLPSTRDVSNKIFAEASIPSFDPKYNHLLMQFGQWIAHDIVFTPTSVGANGAALDCSQCESANVTSNCAPIEVPNDDAYFPTKTSNGKKFCMRLTRAINGQTGLGPRTPINQNSHFLDLSQVYGSTDCVAKELRNHQDGQMKMYTDRGYTLPPRADNDSNCQSQNTQYLCFKAGDSRNSLHPGLIPMHTIYLRQHNKWAAQIKQLRPTWDDDFIYNETRRLMIALYQYHVYSEYLPKIIGRSKMSDYDLSPSGLKVTYDGSVDPSISVEFGTAAFRFGHSQARKDIPRVNNDNSTVGYYVDLGANIFYSDSIYDTTTTVFNVAQGLVNSPAMAVDRQFSFPIRNQLFATRGWKPSGVDLPAVNVQRAREMGVQGYNEVRAKIPGLARVSSFDALSNDMDQANIDLLKKTYASVDDIDLYVGVLLEKPTDSTALVGPTGSTIIADQFSALKKGDRYFYQSTSNGGPLTQDEYDAISNFTLAQLICENTDGMANVQNDIFQFNADKLKCSEFQPFPLSSILL